MSIFVCHCEEDKECFTLHFSFSGFQICIKFLALIELDVETVPCSIVVVVVAEGRSVRLVNKRPVKPHVLRVLQLVRN